MKKIVLTGGGTAGHVMPNVALLPYLKDFEIHYIGQIGGIEERIMTGQPGVAFHGIHCGKLRRYISKENIKDFFNFQKGIRESKKLLKKIRPDVIFSKGGYVAVPVATAAKRIKIPLISHESDLTPGLANRMIAKSAKVVLTTFPETAGLIPDGKGRFAGPPIRDSLFEGDRQKGLSFLGFSGAKPVLAIMGGSMGSRAVNDIVRNNLEYLCERFDVVHMCGKGNLLQDADFSPAVMKGYRQYEFITDELADVLAATDLVITRGGSNSIHEFAAIAKPMIIIPLSRKASRGDQIENADSFEKRGFALKLSEDDVTDELFREAVGKLEASRGEIAAKLEAARFADGTRNIFEEIVRVVGEQAQLQG